MIRLIVNILVILVCGSMLIGCNVSKPGINENLSQVASQKNGIANVTAAIQSTGKTVEQTAVEAVKSNPVPVAYVSIDINPSIELGVDSIDNVVSVEAYNEDGKKILSVCNVIGMNLKEAVKLLVAEASKQGFIASDGSSVISITTETLDISKADNLKKLSEDGALEALDDCGDCASVYKDNIEFSIREEAKKAGISTGKLMLIKKLILLDPTIIVGQYKDVKVSDIITQIKVLSGKQYNSIMNDDVDCTDGCMDDCSCVDCSDCNDDHCDADCTDGCNEIVLDPANCADDCKDVSSGNACKECRKASNLDGNNVNLNTSNEQMDESAGITMDAAEEKVDQELDITEIND
jgi:hypothetical protein